MYNYRATKNVKRITTLHLACGDILHFVAYARQVLLKCGLRDDYRSATIVRVEAQGVCLFESAVEKKDHMVLGVVNQTEGTDAAGFETEVAHHPFGRGEG